MRIMRVAYICCDPGVPAFGRKGCSIHVQEVIRALLTQGAQVDLFTTRPDGAVPPDLQSVRVHRVPFTANGDPAKREQAALAANRDLSALLEREGPFDLAYERYSLWSFAGQEYARRASIPGVLEVNAPLIEEQAQHRILIDRVAAERVARSTFAAATALLAVSHEVADYLHAFSGTTGRVHVIPNGVNPDRFPKHLQPLCPAPGRFTVGFVGTLKPWHGLSVLVEAFALLFKHSAEIRLLIIGDGPERARVEDGLQRRGLRSRAHFAGAVEPAEVPHWLASMDVAVAPYPHDSGFYFSPLKVYEYMAAGLPVVASQTGQLKSLIRHRVNGSLCPPGDAEALAFELDWLREHPEERSRLGKAARRLVLEQHTWRSVAEQILRIGQPALNPRD